MLCLCGGGLGVFYFGGFVVWCGFDVCILWFCVGFNCVCVGSVDFVVVVSSWWVGWLVFICFWVVVRLLGVLYGFGLF